MNLTEVAKGRMIASIRINCFSIFIEVAISQILPQILVRQNYDILFKIKI